MKVAIVTIFGDNYGNKLQNYALQALLESLGHNAKTIIVKDGVKLHHPDSRKEAFAKYSPKYLSRVMSSRFKNKHPYKNQRDGLRASVRFGKTDIPQRLNTSRSDAFRAYAKKYINIDDAVYLPGSVDYTDDYDAYICGSDQIWNPTYSSTGAAYFLQFAPEHKRIAFAPSFGVSRIAEELKPLYSEWLNGIPYLSVREEKGAQLIKELTGRDVPVLPDPTLCLSRDQWESVESKPGFADDQPYVLTYFLGNETNKYRKFIENYAKQIDAKIIDLFDMREPEYYSADPAEFVWLIHHAKAMFTDSFHGTVFSLIFHTPFLVFDRIESGGMGMSSRIETLLGMVGSEDRMFGKTTDITGIDFARADKIIASRAETAKDFLGGALRGVENASAGDDAVSPYVLSKKALCTGCAACAGACPVKCITMEADSEGFRYPVIDKSKCIHCGKCERICSEASAEVDRSSEKAYAAWSKNTVLRSSSSSGGLFSELAGQILSLGGTVYGAGFDDDFKVIHKSADSAESLSALRGSKYVQSQTDACYSEIKDKLNNGEYVYFSGTPCQVDGLLAYLGKEYEKLFTQDIICHGVPSPSVWQEYLALKAKGSRVERVSFRDKTYGWHYFSMLIKTEKGKYIKRLDEDVFTRLFLENVILRPSCYTCRHKHLHRKADITIADCWGGTFGMKDEDKGISLAFANTEKGQKLMDKISGNLEIKEIPFEKASSAQGAMTKSVPYNQNRELFFSMAEKSGIRKTIEEWFGSDSEMLMKRKIGYRKYKIARRIKK